jgi:hypothetical protein
VAEVLEQFSKVLVLVETAVEQLVQTQQLAETEQQTLAEAEAAVPTSRTAEVVVQE